MMVIGDFSSCAFLFIGGIYTKEMDTLFFRKSDSPKQDAANQMQWKFIQGFDSYGLDLEIINAPFLKRFPYGYKNIKTPFFKFSHLGDNIKIDTNIGYVNLPFLRNESKFRNAKKHIKSWLSLNAAKTKIILLYSLNSFTSKCAGYIKKLDKTAKICMIVPDLPEYAYSKKNIIVNFFIDHEVKKSYRYLECCDCFVGLTQKMKERLSVNKDFILIDCLINQNYSPLTFSDYEQNECWITYTGTLSEKYGILMLINEFLNANLDNFELHICGTGNPKIENTIQKICSQNENVFFHGQLSHEETYALQRKSLLLINPRENEGEYTKYSFPSKNAEYMFSSVPTAFYKLDGISDYYFEYAFKLDDYESLASFFRKVAKMDRKVLWEYGNKAGRFIADNKNPIKQCGKILQWVKGDAR